MNVRKFLSTALVPITMASVAVLSGCNADSGDSNISTGLPTAALSGRLIDTAAQNVASATSSVDQARTNNNGVFQYRTGESVVFTIGDLVLGVADGATLLTPIDLVDGARVARNSGMSLDSVYSNFPAVINIARMLQSLDMDSDTQNGLQIPEEAHSKAATYADGIDFSDPALYDSNTSAVQFICAVKVARGLESAGSCDKADMVSEADAKAEVTFTENEIDAGNGINWLPSVSAGPDQEVLENTAVSLNGGASDIDGSVDTTTVLWQVTDKNGVPRSSSITITNANQYNASFTAPAVDTDTIVYLALSVEDNDGGKGTDIVNILVKSDTGNLPPVADAGGNQTVSGGTPVTLDGSGSSDDGMIASYQWQQIDGSGNAVMGGPALTGATTDTATFTAPTVTADTTLIFRLTVTDDGGAIGTDVANVTVQASGSTNTPPVVNAGADQTVNENTGVTLTGTASDDDGDPLTYQWTQTGATKDTYPVDLTGATTKTASFTAPEVDAETVLSFLLTVNDGTVSVSDSVDVTVNDIPAAPATCDPETLSFDPQACADAFCGLFPGDAGAGECDAFATLITNCSDETCVQTACELTVGTQGEYCGSFGGSGGSAAFPPNPLTANFCPNEDAAAVADGRDVDGQACFTEASAGGGSSIPVDDVTSAGCPNESEAATAEMREVDPGACIGEFTTTIGSADGFSPNSLTENFCPDETAAAVAEGRDIDPGNCFSEASGGSSGDVPSGIPPNPTTAGGCPDEDAAATAEMRDVDPAACIAEYSGGIGSLDVVPPNDLMGYFCPEANGAGDTVDPSACFSEASAGDGNPGDAVTAEACPEETANATLEMRTVEPGTCFGELAADQGFEDAVSAYSACFDACSAEPNSDTCTQSCNGAFLNTIGLLSPSSLLSF